MDYKKKIDRAWKKHDQAIENFEKWTTISIAVILMVVLFIVPIHWDHVIWSDFLWLGAMFVLLFTLYAIQRVAIKAYTERKDEVLGEDLVKIERSHRRDLEIEAAHKYEDSILEDLPGPIYITL